MANIHALHAVGNAIVSWLQDNYPTTLDGQAMPACAFALLSSGELASPPPDGTRLTLYLYRATVSEQQHPQRPDRMSSGPQAPLALDLHCLMTLWADKPQDELVPLAWAMRELHQHPILDASSLSPEAGWAPDEVVQVIPSALSVHDMACLWDTFEPSYRLSVSYVARLVRLAPDRFGSGSASPPAAGARRRRP